MEIVGEVSKVGRRSAESGILSVRGKSTRKERRLAVVKHDGQKTLQGVCRTGDKGRVLLSECVCALQVRPHHRRVDVESEEVTYICVGEEGQQLREVAGRTEGGAVAFEHFEGADGGRRRAGGEDMRKNRSVGYAVRDCGALELRREARDPAGVGVPGGIVTAF